MNNIHFSNWISGARAHSWPSSAMARNRQYSATCHSGIASQELGPAWTAHGSRPRNHPGAFLGRGRNLWRNLCRFGTWYVDTCLKQLGGFHGQASLIRTTNRGLTTGKWVGVGLVGRVVRFGGTLFDWDLRLAERFDLEASGPRPDRHMPVELRFLAKEDQRENGSPIFYPCCFLILYLSKIAEHGEPKRFDTKKGVDSTNPCCFGRPPKSPFPPAPPPPFSFPARAPPGAAPPPHPARTGSRRCPPDTSHACNPPDALQIHVGCQKNRRTPCGLLKKAGPQKHWPKKGAHA